MAYKATITLKITEKALTPKIKRFSARQVWRTICFILSFYLKKEPFVNMLRNQPLEGKRFFVVMAIIKLVGMARVE